MDNKDLFDLAVTFEQLIEEKENCLSDIFRVAGLPFDEEEVLKAFDNYSQGELMKGKREKTLNWSWEEVKGVEDVMKELGMGNRFSVSMTHDDFRLAIE